MRKIIPVLIAAPLAVALSACGETTPADEATPEPVEADVPVTLPTIPVNSLTTIEYPGTYSKETEDGGIAHITLNGDDTYEYDPGDGNIVKGSYTRMEDGSRVQLEDFNGESAIFAVGTGAIYRMESADTPLTEVSEATMYSRDKDYDPAAEVEEAAEDTAN
ncbi:hypothetical protein D6851_04875 [Altericroceibacterium spongiae]|uniref:Copper resistance protein NlpE n=1 Tax=Altericroceibacterium spongiae TaxID=2320269 RepID=A0A420EPF1_9SPHN|nr:hypothetical protein [Altericroceibacterium spongiae]RKF22555.1 hypothetical protein D6851_04875 [Altericroceibacterium spongiae]